VETRLLKNGFRNNSGFTLPFALILTFIFSSLVGVSYLFVSLNLKQMQSSLQSLQAISVAEGINERIKARLNTKTRMKISPEREQKLKSDEGFDDEEDEEDETAEEDFNEETEDFDEYYADEVLKISRYITFRDPPEPPDDENQEQVAEQATQNQEDPAMRPEANVEMIGNINIPRGTTLTNGSKIVVYKDEKINLKLSDITPEQNKMFREKLPLPVIKSLAPNYCEVGNRGVFTVIGDNINYSQNIRFNNKGIIIEDVKSGPSVEYLVTGEVMPGISKFYWESASTEFYAIPQYDGSSRPVINDIRSTDGNQLFEIKAGQKGVIIKIYGLDLYLKKSPPVVLPDVAGLVPKVKDHSTAGNEITVSIDIDKAVEPGNHSLIVATEGGLSNAWIFNILPPDQIETVTADTAIVSSSLTLLNIRIVDNLLPLIDEGDDIPEDEEDKKGRKDDNPSEDEEDSEEEEGEEIDSELTEKQKLGPFSNTDLETVWLLETTTMIGKITRTVSEMVQRQVPNINAGIITNGEINFDGGSYKVLGATTAMTTLTEPTYISNSVLKISGPEKEEEQQKEPENQDKTKGKDDKKPPVDLGFIPGAFVSVYREGESISELDYSVISTVSDDTLELMPPGLMDFHYEGDSVFQFIPPVISKEKISDSVAEKHIVPKDFSLGIRNQAKFSNIFRSNPEQLIGLADLYTNETAVPQDDYGLPLGYMGLSYIEATPSFSDNNILSGKGIIIIDTRGDNQGRPIGDVEIVGDSKNPVEINGILYIHGNLRIDGNVVINGAVVVDNDSTGQFQISSNALGRITWNPGSIRQTLLYIPFTTKPGTVKISNKPIDLSGYIESASGISEKLGAAPVGPEGAAVEVRPSEKAPDLPPEEALVETVKAPPKEEKPIFESIPVFPGKKSAEEELIDLF